MTISEAAKARGATGFLHKPHCWEVRAEINGTRLPIVPSTTRVKREARRTFDRVKKWSGDSGSRFEGACVSLWRDGVKVKG